MEGAKSKDLVNMSINSFYSETETIIEEETFSYRWTLKIIPYFSQMLQGELLKSPDFNGGPTTGHTWYIYLQKNKKDGIEYLAIYLGLKTVGKESAHNSKVLAIIEFSVLNEKKDAYLRWKETGLRDFFDKSRWGYERFLKTSELLDGTKGYIINDKITIMCRIKLKDFNLRGWVLNEPKVASMISMSQDYNKLLESADNHDLVITTGTYKIKTHKLVLAARSSVFAAMFKPDVAETLRVLPISDFSYDTIKDMIHFLYTGNVKNIKQNGLELIKIAEKYKITSLVNECSQMIRSILTVKNSIETLRAVNKYKLPYLKSQIYNRVFSFSVNGELRCGSGYFRNKDEIKKTDDFQKLFKSFPELFAELMLALV